MVNASACFRVDKYQVSALSGDAAANAVRAAARRRWPVPIPARL
jgi:hypothetical protein